MTDPAGCWLGLGIFVALAAIWLGLYCGWIEWQDWKHARETLAKWDAFVARQERQIPPSRGAP